MFLSGKRILRAFAVTAAATGIVMGTAVGAHATPTSPWSFLNGSDESVNGCEVWMNYATDNSGGFYTQALLESWGNDCEMHYVRTGPSPFSDFQTQNGAGTYTTAGYWDGPGYTTAVCVWKVGQYDPHKCSSAF
jgi:hypothetical protein